MLDHIAITKLIPHPGNPRLTPREDIINQIVAQLNGKMDDAHALIVRPQGKEYEIISGHHRALAAEKAGLKTVPCWVREMSDEDAYMALVLNNAQGELHALEIGVHAFKSTLGVREYAKQVGVSHVEIIRRRASAEVALMVPNGTTLSNQWRQLTEIHAAPSWAWRALVEKLLKEGWTVDATRKQVARFSKISDDLPAWLDLPTIAAAILADHPNPIPGLLQAEEGARRQIEKNDYTPENYLDEIDALLRKHAFAVVSQLQAALNTILDAQAEKIQEARAVAQVEQRERETRAAQTARLRRACSLDEWEALSPAAQTDLLTFTTSTTTSFNKQENADIEWAQWSWNPISGCLHDCPYCYARDIANQTRMEKIYPHGFAPTIHPHSLLAWQGQKVPKEAETDMRFRNVFTVSMGDLFGRWVPKAWIEAVLAQVKIATQWNFLFLTKFPGRMAEFTYPKNAWLGTTVDLQARVAAAEKAFAHVDAPVRWLSIEPLLEPLRFKHLDRFHWMVIGGASPSTQTPAWKPPFAWIYDLVQQARDAGVKVYFKSNLLGNPTRLLELPFDAPLTQDTLPLPDVFKYLKDAA